jgi:hypothetical protein
MHCIICLPLANYLPARINYLSLIVRDDNKRCGWLSLLYHCTCSNDYPINRSYCSSKSPSSQIYLLQLPLSLDLINAVCYKKRQHIYA